LQKFILADPQTSGGLLIAVEADTQEEFEALMEERGFELQTFGKLVEKREKVVYVK